MDWLSWNHKGKNNQKVEACCAEGERKLGALHVFFCPI